MSISWRVTTTADSWDAVANHLEQKANLIAAKVAMDLEAQAKTRAPVDTGTLKNSIQATKVGPAHWRVVVGAEYGAYVNFGTKFQAAQPFWDNAIAAVRPQFQAALKGLLS